MAARAPAPAPLETIRAFVNTLDLESGGDAMATPAGAAQFLTERDLAPRATRVTAPQVRQLQELREAVRALLLHNNGVPLTEDAVAVLNRAADRAKLGARFSSDGVMGLGPRDRGIDGATGALLAIVFEAVADGTWGRLKACRDEQCHWAFYDRSRNRSSQWCVMAVCGNRNKARVYRARNHAPER